MQRTDQAYPAHIPHALSSAPAFSHMGMIPLLGTVQAGFASPVEEELADILNLEDYLIRDKDASFMLMVQGDSLLRHGICSGDLVIFERGTDMRPGELAVFLGEDGYVIRFLADRMSCKTMPSETESESKSDEEAYISDTCRYIGAVISVVRRYRA